MEDFVPFELAVKLREKGFAEECLAYYTSEYTLCLNKVVLCDDKYLEVAEIDYEECLRSYNTKKDRLLRTIVNAPTIPQVLKWLREDKKLHISIDVILVYDKYKYVFCITNLVNHDRDSTFEKFDSHEPTAIAAIEYALNYLIEED